MEPDPAAYRVAKAQLNAEHRTRAHGHMQAVAGPPVPVNFPGLTENDGGRFVPSDSTGAIGPTEYIELVNDAYGIYGRRGSQIAKGSLAEFVGVQEGVCATGGVTDPQIMWDPTTNRFYYVVLNFDTDPNLLCIGLSKTNAPRAPGDFCHYQADYGYGTGVPDYPKLGDSKDFLMIGVNYFDSSETYQGSDLDTLTKPPGTGPITTCPAPSLFRLAKVSEILNADGSKAFTPVPANEIDTSGTGWVVATHDVSQGGSSDYITVYAVTNQNGNPVLGPPQTVSISTYTMPPDAPQKGTTNLIDTFDGRLTNAVASVDPVHGNQMAIWTQHGENEDFGSTVRWFEINPSASALFQHGEIPPPPGQYVDYIYNGAISSDRKVNGTRAAYGADMAIGFNTSNANSFVTDQVVSQSGSNTLSNYSHVATSSNSFQQVCNTPRNPDDCPWGDYSSASPDPAGTRGMVWFTNARVDSTGDWATQNWATLTGIINEFPLPTPSSSPNGIAAGPDGNLWFTELSGKIGKLTLSGSFNEYTIPTSGSFPWDIVAGPDGNLWFTENIGNKIGKVSVNGSFIEYTIPTASSYPAGITAGPDGNLWFTEAAGNRIGKVTVSGTFTEYTIPTASSYPAGITAGPDGNLWFTESGTKKIGKITTSGGFTEYSAPLGGGLSGITAGPDGNLWFTDAYGFIGKVTPAGVFTEYITPQYGSSPVDIAAGSDGNLWFTDAGLVNMIGKVTPSGSFTEYSIPTSDSSPEGIAAGPDGNMWFTEEIGNNIGKAALH